MRKTFSNRGFEDFLYWQAHDKKTFKKILDLLKDIDRNGYNCKGKPEKLSGNYVGYWSVRIDKKNRLIMTTPGLIGKNGLGKTREGDVNYKYNQMIDIRDFPNLNKNDSEHLIDYSFEYKYALNISYNENGKAGAGSAIFFALFRSEKNLDRRLCSNS